MKLQPSDLVAAAEARERAGRRLGYAAAIMVAINLFLLIAPLFR